MHVISDIATDPNVSRRLGAVVGTIAEAVKEGINVRVIQNLMVILFQVFQKRTKESKMKNEYREIESTLDLVYGPLSDSF